MSEIKYKVNEIFYSVQAEGMNAGRPAAFVRLAGCNLKCPFCDTKHEPFKEMMGKEIEAEIEAIAPRTSLVVFTGGEPTIQLRNNKPLLQYRERAIETNGIIPAPPWIEWVTISPKTKLKPSQLIRASELKFVYGTFTDGYLEEIGDWAQSHHIPCFIQPMADDKGVFDAGPAIRFAKAHPHWRLSLQFHKLINIQ